MKRPLLWCLGMPFLLLGLGLENQGAIAQTLSPENPDDLGQVTSVSQLSDVQPTDWAFQAVQSLVERYGCIAGYPDSSFRGNRSATRYELAAALNACLDNISDKFATKEELEQVKALQEEFQAELATIRGRVDSLEARTSTLEAQQFSTTTKLQGQAIFAGQFGDQIDEGGGPGQSRATAIGRVRLSLNTSFSGDDLLETTLETGNAGNDFFTEFFDNAPSNNPVPFPAPTAESITNLGAVDYTGGGPEVGLYRLAYSFSPTEDLSLTVGPQLYPSDFIDANSFANDESADFSSGFFINNRLIINNAVDGPGGAGGSFDWNINGGPFSLRGLYVASSPTNAAGDADIDGDGVTDGVPGGLFGDPFQGSAELEYAQSFGPEDQNSVAVRLQYTRSETLNLNQNVLGLNAEASFGQFGVFGRYGISLDPKFNGADLFANNNRIQTWMAGVGVRDVIIPGSLLAVAAGQPFIAPGPQPDQTNYEAFYRFPINDNITITPTVMVITDPLNVNDNTLIQGVLRTTFSF
jgi:hypothetical protein